jgi:DNA-binding NarL/FixJ family response regulator
MAVDFLGPMKVLIADDHELLRQAMRLALSDEQLGLSFAEANGFDAAVEALAADGADLLLIDLSMPGMAGAASLRALRETYPATKIAVLTGADERSTILECLAAGIHGYIVKSSPTEEIVNAVKTILAGSVYVTPAVAHLATTKGANNGPATLSQSGPVPRSDVRAGDFTPRQRDVLRLLGQGRPTKEIARELELGEGTVKVHLAAIYRILNARNRTEAVLMASKLEL